MNVCSSEKVSQAIHDYLCWTPFLKEFYAYNTTLYIDQVQSPQQQKQDRQGTDGEDPVIRDQGLQQKTRNTSASSHAATVKGRTPTCTSPVLPDSRPNILAYQWACTGLERLVVRFAHLPWRNLSEPPKRSENTFGFLKPLQKLKQLCIKEGLMLEAGREYDALVDLRSLEELVFTTCYPIPIKPKDMAWMSKRTSTAMKMKDATTTETRDSMEQLKRVIIRQQKANTTQDKEMVQWFKENRPELTFSFELTDCSEDDYSFE
jgi:hypothetical protein